MRHSSAADAGPQTGNEGGDARGTLQALATAFDSALTDALSVEVVPTPESVWFAEINDSNQGPLSRSKLAGLVREGRVSSSSLIWRDGFSEWVRVSEVEELAGLIEDARKEQAEEESTGREESRSMAGDKGRANQTSGVDLSLAFADDGGACATTKDDLDSEVTRDGVVTEAAVVGDSDSLEIPGLKRRGAPSAMGPLLAILAALALGLTAGYVVFSADTQATAVVGKSLTVGGQTDGVAVGKAPATGPRQGESDAKLPPESEIALGDEATVVAPRGDLRAKRESHQEKLAPRKRIAKEPAGLSGLRGLANLRAIGPEAKPAPGDTGGSNGDSLDATAIQRTVGRYKAGVKRSCWEPAISARLPNAPRSARVQVSVRINSEGSVESASSSGDPRGYRGLARCIQGRVRGWRFPASNGTTTARIPFVFASQ